jgi:hypothetical protein
LPRMRPRCCFLNLTFFGINIMRSRIWTKYA